MCDSALASPAFSHSLKSGPFRSSSAILVSMPIETGEYAVTPRYNIKAVVQATGIGSSTLRAWERRYGICHPQRTASGYRLYSERDIAVLRWLKAQVDSGMSISKAAAWLQTHENETGDVTELTKQPPARRTAHSAANDRPIAPAGQQRPPPVISALREKLLDALLSYQEDSADTILAEAFAAWPVEQVCEELIVPILVEIGDRWNHGEVRVTTEHFASTYLMHRLIALLRDQAVPSEQGSIWVGCAPGELHEIGAVLLALYLRRAGFPVHFLGQNLPKEDLLAEVHRQKPRALLLSATTFEAVEGLRSVASQVAGMTDARGARLIFGYGGRAFATMPELRAQIEGQYLGDTAQEAVEALAAALDSTRLSPATPAPRMGSGRTSHMASGAA